MASLPYSRVVKVDLTRRDAFPTIRGFGVPLVLVDRPALIPATLGPAQLTKVYSDLTAIGTDFGVTSAAYLTAQGLFTQNPTPAQIKIGYVDSTSAATVTTGLNNLVNFDDGWYWLVPCIKIAADQGRWVDDAARVTAIMTWTETKRKLLVMPSYDANTENAATTTSIAALNKTLWERSAVAYHDVANTPLHAGIVAYGAIRNFDSVDSSYTIKFKRLNGIAVVDKGSAVIQAVTGFVPGTGMDNTQGHFANTYVDIGGTQFVTEGQTLKGGFIDEIHFSDWVVTRTEEEVLALFTTTAKVPYTDVGIDMIVQCANRVLKRARAAGNIEPYVDANGDDQLFLLTVPKVSTVSAAQRRQRIAPTIKIEFKYSGAIHYTALEYTMTF